MVCAPLLLLPCASAQAGESGDVDGAHLGLVWVLPFAGILLSLAILPLVAP